MCRFFYPPCVSHGTAVPHPLAVLTAAVLWLFCCGQAQAQFFGECFEGSQQEFRRSIASHAEHTFRLYHKFHRDYYFQGQMPEDFEGGTLEDVRRFIADLAPRKTGVLFYGLNTERQPNRLCSWLVTPSEQVYGQVARISGPEFSRRISGLVRAHGRGVSTVASPLPHPGVWSEIGQTLLPPRIREGLLAEDIDTLVVVPIFTVGALPYAAFPLEGAQLVDRISVVVAPGFFVFQEPPRHTRVQWPDGIVAGDPVAMEPGFAPLAGARKEAQVVAALFGARPLTGTSATAEAVCQAIDERPDRSLVYLATHGIADGDNPQDDSFLLMSDGRWTAREVGKLCLKNDPLVVLSACQTGLGKNFDVGTIGMARAWQQAGASQVVMSLWNVNDAVTGDLMVRFAEGIKAGQPVDKALQIAMRETRDSGAGSPALWAGFAVFGVPTR